VAQKEGAIGEDGDIVEAFLEEETDVEDDVVKPLWARHAPGLPRLEMCRRRMHVSVLPVPHVLGRRPQPSVSVVRDQQRRPPRRLWCGMEGVPSQLTVVRAQ
jgi:hypothetical protein